VKLASAFLAAFIVAVVVSFLGGPVWAAYGFSYLAYIAYRHDDRFRP
jgi:hypothetical protein